MIDSAIVMNRIIMIVFYILFLLMFLTAAGSANMVNVSFENDILYYHDRYYTHGTRILYVKEGSYKWFENLYPNKNSQSGYSVAQYMYTPSDLKATEFLPEDRPYGGWLYGGYSLIAYDSKELDFWELDIGTTGKSSYSDETQIWMHKQFGAQHPNGWKYQIRDELGADLIYQKKYKIKKDYYDIIPNYGACVGNIYDYLNCGSTFRIGYRLPDDFGTYHMEPTTREKKKFYSYVFTSVDGKCMMRNIFLDGNTFKESPSVEKNNVIFSLSLGACVYFCGNEIIYMYNYKSDEFKAQEYDTEFSSLYLSRYF